MSSKWYFSPKFISTISLFSVIGVHLVSASMDNNYQVIHCEQQTKVVERFFKAWK